ncbi:hypothetical protein V6N12_060891 [Hibiscus sabdariffa]|uniref:Uncharacterized protein n=1 Tax=Hibiscus sabdariffa TaxID=183260 RepID=A0ABR2A503_9ROSI
MKGASITDKIDVSTAVDSSQVASPVKTVDATSPTVVVSTPRYFTHPDVIVFVKESEGSKTIGTVLGLVAVESSDPVNFILKKIQRVVRFSVPIQLSEQEKRNSRVERFYKKEVEEVMVETDELNKQINALIALRIKVDNPAVVGGGIDVVNLADK